MIADLLAYLPDAGYLCGLGIIFTAVLTIASMIEIVADGADRDRRDAEADAATCPPPLPRSNP